MDESIPKLENEINDTIEPINNKEISYLALGRSILQIAKQGISKTHGNPQNYPYGRIITTQSLKNIVWQGRNQAIHHEEGNYNNNVKDCFTDLKNNFGVDFDLSVNSTKNLSTKVIDRVLKWHSYIDYYNDMISLS